MRKAIFGLIAFVFAAITGVGFASQATAAETDWYLTVGLHCDATSPFQLTGDCGPRLVVRVPYSIGSEDDAYAFKTLHGPAGDVFSDKMTIPEYWSGSAPDTQYRGHAFVTHTPTGLPAGSYRYVLDVRVPGEWHCSAYNRDVCSWMEDQHLTYSYAFVWDGTSTVVVPPTWKVATSGAKKICGTKGCAVIVAYATNTPDGTAVELQRKRGTTAWRTIDRDKNYGGSGWFADTHSVQNDRYRVVARSIPNAISTVMRSPIR